jgi:hypothetical protein
VIGWRFAAGVGIGIGIGVEDRQKPRSKEP